MTQHISTMLLKGAVELGGEALLWRGTDSGGGLPPLEVVGSGLLEDAVGEGHCGGCIWLDPLH